MWLHAYDHALVVNAAHLTHIEVGPKYPATFVNESNPQRWEVRGVTSAANNDEGWYVLGLYNTEAQAIQAGLALAHKLTKGTA